MKSGTGKGIIFRPEEMGWAGAVRGAEGGDLPIGKMPDGSGHGAFNIIFREDGQKGVNFILTKNMKGGKPLRCQRLWLLAR